MSANAQNVDIGFEKDNQEYFINDNMGLIHTPSYKIQTVLYLAIWLWKKKVIDDMFKGYITDIWLNEVEHLEAV